MSFDVTSGLSSVGSTIQSAAGALGAGLNVAARLGSAVTNLSSPAGLLSAIRSINLPVGGESISKIIASSASFTGVDAGTDWRVRLSMPKGSFFDNSPILRPLWEAGGLIFPYTPSISINHTASYNEMAVVHQNYQFNAYQNSRVSDIQITGDFSVEDAVQAQYWLAAVHFLRSVTKMYTGDTAYAGNPPPVLNFSGYGDYVFRNVPVVVKSFSMSLPKDVNYISTNVSAGVGSGLDTISRTANQIAGIASALGDRQTAQTANTVRNVSSLVAGAIPGTAGGQRVAGGSYVPTKSDLTITLMPVYSRENVKQFSLQQFVSGAYVNRGYI